MTNLEILTHNVYATNDSGTRFRAVHIAGTWRLYQEGSRPGSWDRVNDLNYANGLQAIQDADRC